MRDVMTKFILFIFAFTQVFLLTPVNGTIKDIGCLDGEIQCPGGFDSNGTQLPDVCIEQLGNHFHQGQKKFH